MNTKDRDETIVSALIGLIALALFVWSWRVSDSFGAALICTIVGGFFLTLLIGPALALIAFIISVVADLIGSPRSRS